MKKFIIKINEWCIYWVKGEIEDLINKLKSIGIEVIGEQHSCRFVHLDILFDSYINTKTMCLGNNYDGTEKALKDIKSFLASNYSKRLSEEVYGCYDLRRCVSDYFREVPHFSDVVRIYVESDEKYEIPPNTLIIPTDYESIDNIDKEDFWYYMEQLVGQYEPD